MTIAPFVVVTFLLLGVPYVGIPLIIIVGFTLKWLQVVITKLVPVQSPRKPEQPESPQAP
ncbi:MAG: hypothetical protein HZA24_12100 [Nitrospirae bacterium]|nr:hypothetical protein [Nitrospirota bacterium]